MSETDRTVSKIVRLEVDRSRCVLCGEPNDCAIAAREAKGEDAAAAESEEPCWCVERSFPESLTARAREIDGGARCICQTCLSAAD